MFTIVLVLRRLWSACFTCLLLALVSFAWAQVGSGFNAQNYYQQCLQFETGGDLEAARQSCINALQVNAGYTDAALALARIEYALGNYSEAERRLQSIKDQVKGAEPYILLARVALATDRLDQASLHLSSAGRRLTEQYNNSFAGQRYFLLGELSEARGDIEAAVSNYQSALQADRLVVEYPLAEARLNFRLGNLEAAERSLESYLRLTGDADADILSMLAKVKWAQSDFAGAIKNMDAAILQRGTMESEALGTDLFNLALIYYGQGDLRSGELTLRAAYNRGGLLRRVLMPLLPWLIVLVVLFSLHLLGESRVEPTAGLEFIEGPEEWSVGQVYGVLLLGLIAALALTFLYGYMRYQNYLAFFTPIQATETRSLFLVVISVLLPLLAWVRVSTQGWDASEVLLGPSGHLGTGLGIGLVLLAGVIAYQLFVPELSWLGSFYLDFKRLSPLLVAAVVTLPLSELYFRAFAVPPLKKRYTPLLAVLISATLYALVLGTPLALLLLFGLLLAHMFRRNNSGVGAMTAQYVLNLGLLLGVLFSGWMVALFL